MRSSADGSVLQFVAGEDGLDPTRVSFLQKQDFYRQNASVFSSKWEPPARAPARLSGPVALARREARLRAQREVKGQKGGLPPIRAPCLSEASPSSALGIVSEKFDEVRAADGLEAAE